MYNITAYKVNPISANIEQLPIKRDWMEDTNDRHAYNCFPVTLSNGLGWGISYPEDIVFRWNGISDYSPHNVQIISGHQYVYTERANASLSFKTGLTFVTNENLSILHMPVPNLFSDEFIPFTTLISTSFFKGELPSAIRIIKANKEIIIKANTPVVSIIPISLSNFQNSKIDLYNFNQIPPNIFNISDGYSEAVYELNKQGKWSNFYRDAVDHLGNKLGNHEVKTIRLETVKRYE